MQYAITTATKKIANLKKRIKIIQGGTSAGKTIGILEVLIDKCQSEDGVGDITSVTSESFPHLKRGAIRDFLSIMQGQGYFEDSRWNKTDYIYTFETGAVLEFFSSDQPSKTRGPRRKRLFMNEANNMPFETFEQLEIRTTDDIYIDYNPTNEFWVQLELLGKRDDIDFIVLTYKDNEALQQAIIDSIEQRRNRKGWWKVYGEGQLGEVEGRILSGWQIIDDIPFEAKLERHTLDFGYTNDESGIVDIYYYNGGYIWDEILYQKGMDNKKLADVLTNLSPGLTIADSSEPKSIDEIKGYGVNIIGVSKTRGETKLDTFIKWSFGILQSEKISMTKRSVNLIKEYRNLLWMVDKNGKVLNIEDPSCKNHLISAGRYGMVSIIPIRKKDEILRTLPRINQERAKNPAL